VVTGLIAPGPSATEKRLRWAAAITPEDARPFMRLGLMDYGAHDGEGLARAIGLLRRSVSRNPTDGRAWLVLARSYEDLGVPDAAVYAYKRAGLAERNDRAVQWDTAVLLLTQGLAKEAAPFFRRYIALYPSERPAVYALFFTMGFDPSYTLETLVAKEYGEYRAYLDFLMAQKLMAESEAVWQKMGAWERSRNDYLVYVDFLINAGAIDPAVRTWEEYRKAFGLLGDPESVASLIWNGGFELPVQDGGFDWRLGKTAGVRVFVDHDVRRSGRASLSAQFDGTQNLDVYLVYQVVPITAGGRYLLTGRLSTDGLTTRNGIILEVSGLRCTEFVKKTEPVTGSTPWTDLELDFTVPDDCKAIKVGIKREKSDRFDNKISGDVWVDSISLRKSGSHLQSSIFSKP
jgi:hypothetical protein